MSSLSKSAFWLTVSKIATTAINMLVVMLLSRFRTLEEYGIYSQINIINTVVTSITAIGLPTGINYFLNKTEEIKEKKDFLSAYFSLGTVIGFITAIGLGVALPLLVIFFNNANLYSYWFAIILLPWITLFNNSADNFFVSYGKTYHLIFYRTSYGVILLITAGIFSIAKGSFYFYMILFIAIQVVYALLLYYLIYRISGGYSFKFDFKIIKDVLSYCIPLGIAAIVSTLNIELDKIVVSGAFDTETLAIYTNAAKELPLNMLTVSILTVVLPKMVFFINNKKTDEAITLWGVSINMSAIIICFASAVLVVFAEPIMTILYSEKYLVGIDIFRIYSITSLVKITSWGIVLNSTRNTKALLNISISTLICNIILNYLFLWLIGINGMAIATLISEFTGIILKLYSTSKIVNRKIWQLIPYKKLSMILICNIVFAVVVFITYNTFLKIFAEKWYWLITAVIGVVWAVIYLLMMYKPFKKLNKSFNSY